MTFIPFPDICVESANQKLRLEIVGDEGEHPEFFRNQSHFIYRLFDVVNDREQWSWPSCNLLSDCPHDAWVHNNGWVVARLHNWHDGGLLVLSPDGKLKMLQPIKTFEEDSPGFLQDEPDWHIGSTSAGPTWDECSIALMHTFEERPFWSMRTWWGRRIVIDLRQGEFIENISPLHEQRIKQQEIAIVKQQLENSLAELANAKMDDYDWWRITYHPITTAVYHAGSLKMKEAVPILRQLESCVVVAREGSEIGMKCLEQRIRLVTKASLMKIGVEPQWIANMEFRDKECDQKLEVPEIAPNRIPENIQIGMELFTVLREVGMPEMMRGHWDYWFFQDNVPLNVRVSFKTAEGKDPGFMDYREFVPLYVDDVQTIPGFPWEADLYVAYSLAH